MGKSKKMVDILVVVIAILILLIFKINIYEIGNTEKLILLPIGIFIIHYFIKKENTKLFFNLYRYIIMIFLLKRIYHYRFMILYLYLFLYLTSYVLFVRFKKCVVVFMMIIYISTYFMLT